MKEVLVENNIRDRSGDCVLFLLSSSNKLWLISWGWWEGDLRLVLGDTNQTLEMQSLVGIWFCKSDRHGES